MVMVMSLMHHEVVLMILSVSLTLMGTMLMESLRRIVVKPVLWVMTENHGVIVPFEVSQWMLMHSAP
jgi:hypothetical protein